LDREALMERFHSHTIHCRSCSGALKGIQRWRPWLAAAPWLAVLAVAWWRTPLALALSLPLAVVSVGMGVQLNRWEALLRQGAGTPPRNQG